jgi:CDGSH-type Zn-finger protein
MAEAKIAAKTPTVMQMEPGTYYWCACGQSSNQPFCDGSHKGSEFEPVEFTIEEKRSYALCRCKRTGKSPFCDGTHSSLDD